MSSGREKNDGAFFGGYSGTTEWGDPVSTKSQTLKPASSKRTVKYSRFIEDESGPQNEESEKDRYLITYADLITLLLGLFIILYAISNIDSKKYHLMLGALGSTFGSVNKVISIEPVAVAKNAAPAIIQLKDKLYNVIKEQGYGNFVNLEENERGITIHIMDQILFNSGSATLESKSFEILNKIAALIKGLPNDIRVEGHTDNIPIHTLEFPSNWHLSVARALNTAYYLIDTEKLPQDKLSVVGYSEYKPMAQNDSFDDRAKNRRVDIIIIK